MQSNKLKLGNAVLTSTPRAMINAKSHRKTRPVWNGAQTSGSIPSAVENAPAATA